jgi:hypothetical protein
LGTFFTLLEKTGGFWPFIDAFDGAGWREKRASVECCEDIYEKRGSRSKTATPENHWLTGQVQRKPKNNAPPALSQHPHLLRCSGNCSFLKRKLISLRSPGNQSSYRIKRPILTAFDAGRRRKPTAMAERSSLSAFCDVDEVRF